MLCQLWRGPLDGYAPAVQPRRVAPYFVLAAAVHAAAIATRFPDLAARLPPGTADALMVVQGPLLLLSAFLEGRLDYGPQLAGFPLWMRIKSMPVKLAFTTAFIYVTVVAAQTFHVSLGPVDPAAPESFSPQQRALWFAMFTGGFFFIYYIAACGMFIPVLRAVTRPLRALPFAVGAVLAVAIGAAAGGALLAAASNQAIPTFADRVQAAAAADPVVFAVVGIAGLAVPWLVGVVVERVNRD